MNTHNPVTFEINLVTNQVQLPQENTISKIDDEKHLQTPQSVVRVKSEAKMVVIGLILALSAINYGYSLKEITSVPISDLVNRYQINMGKSAAQSILIGILPLGCLFGDFITHFMLLKTRRLFGIYVFTILNVIAVILININSFATLVAGRFLEGICIGYYTLLAPIYLRQIAPKQVRRMLGLFFSFGKIIGILFAVAMELIYAVVSDPVFYRIVLSLTAAFSLLQAILIFLFCPPTPTELIERGEVEEARRVIESLCKKQYVNEVLGEYQREHEIEQDKHDDDNDHLYDIRIRKLTFKESKREIEMMVKQHKLRRNVSLDFVPGLKENSSEASLHLHDHHLPHRNGNLPKLQLKPKEQKNQEITYNGETKEGELTFEQKKGLAFCVGLHLNIIRNWIGSNAVISQGGLFVTNFNPAIGHYTSLIINMVQGIFIVIGLVWIQKLVGKRPLFLFSISTLTFVNLGLVIAMLYNSVLVIMFLMCIYMAIYGGAMSSPIWAYPSEVIPARKSFFTNIAHWLSMAISTLVPPLISGIMPNGNPYPVFLFFAFYGIISFIHIFRYLRQSDGKTFAEIISSYK